MENLYKTINFVAIITWSAVSNTVYCVYCSIHSTNNMAASTWIKDIKLDNGILQTIRQLDTLCDLWLIQRITLFLQDFINHNWYVTAITLKGILSVLNLGISACISWMRIDAAAVTCIMHSNDLRLIKRNTIIRRRFLVLCKTLTSLSAYCICLRHHCFFLKIRQNFRKKAWVPMLGQRLHVAWFSREEYRNTKSSCLVWKQY